MLAIELGRRGISTMVLEEKTTPARFPSANATQARTMEHYRRLGFAEKVRAQGLPPDYPTDIAYFTRYTVLGRQPRSPGLHGVGQRRRSVHLPHPAQAG
jgi:2-polyprenyl-6-methoxyphenol hydroxylase-like FAD-dependent oxidoreductase